MIYTFASCLYLCCIIISVRANSNSLPKRWGDLGQRGRIASLVAAGGLAAGGKVLSDGPIFKEDVDMSGKMVVISGANTGLGKESALRLAELGADVILLCRDEKKCKATEADVKVRAKNPAGIKSAVLDLSSLQVS
jgi:hypothetical protein